jgi:TolA-binding protein
MLRSMPHASRFATRAATTAASLLLAAGALARPTTVRAQDNRPVVVVFTFDNSSIGAGHAEFEGIRTGVQDLLITDMASNSHIRLVDRARINEVLREQNMVSNQQIDPQTAIHLGNIMGAQYAIVGGFMSDGHGKAVLTGRTIDLETTQIANPEKITGSADDVIGLISQLSSRLSANMKLAPKPGAARRTGDAHSGEAKTLPAQSGASHASAPAGNVEQFAKRVSDQPLKVKLDAATLKIYSNALDEADKKNNTKAIELFKQVVDRYPRFEPAEEQLRKLGA